MCVMCLSPLTFCWNQEKVRKPIGKYRSLKVRLHFRGVGNKHTGERE